MEAAAKVQKSSLLYHFLKKKARSWHRPRTLKQGANA
jgi:hypothetical protein